MENNACGGANQRRRDVTCPSVCSLQDAVPGGRSHGVVTGTADFGVFVQFFGGVAGEGGTDVGRVWGRREYFTDKQWVFN